MTTVNKVITLFGDDEEEGNNPFIVSFDSVPQAELLESTGSKRSSGARITCYERPHKRTKKGAAKGSGSASDLSDDDDEDKEAESASSSEDEDDENIDVVAETEKVMFHGTTNGRTTLPMRHAIAIKDNKSGNITFVEVPPVVALHKFMKLGLEDMEEDITREAGTAIAMSDYMKYKNNLTEVFGNHKKKLQIRAATANALPDKIADITEDEIKQTQAVIEEKLKEAADEASTRDLPHCNPKALTAEEAYPLSGMFFSEVLDIVFEKADGLMKFVREGPMSFMHEFAEVCPQVSIYATEIIKNISNVPQEKLRNVITSLVLVNKLQTTTTNIAIFEAKNEIMCFLILCTKIVFTHPPLNIIYIFPLRLLPILEIHFVYSVHTHTYIF